MDLQKLNYFLQGREHNSETPFRVLYERLMKFSTKLQLFKGWINRYAADMGYGNVLRYPLDRDLFCE